MPGEAGVLPAMCLGAGWRSVRGGVGTRPACARRVCASALAFCLMRSWGFGWAAAGFRPGGLVCRCPVGPAGLRRMSVCRFRFSSMAVCRIRSFGVGAAGARSGPGREAAGRSRTASGRRSPVAAGRRLSSGGRVRISLGGLSRGCSCGLSCGCSHSGGGGASVPVGGVSPGGCSVRPFFFCWFRLWREMDFETASAVRSRRLSAVVYIVSSTCSTACTSGAWAVLPPASRFFCRWVSSFTYLAVIWRRRSFFKGPLFLLLFPLILSLFFRSRTSGKVFASCQT